MLGWSILELSKHVSEWRRRSFLSRVFQSKNCPRGFSMLDKMQDSTPAVWCAQYNVTWLWYAGEEQVLKVGIFSESFLITPSITKQKHTVVYLGIWRRKKNRRYRQQDVLIKINNISQRTCKCCLILILQGVHCVSWQARSENKKKSSEFGLQAVYIRIRTYCHCRMRYF